MKNWVQDAHCCAGHARAALGQAFMRFSALLLLASQFPPTLSAQASPPGGLELPDARVAVLTVALYTKQANLVEASDTSRAALGTEMLRSRLEDALGDQLIPFKLVDSLAASPSSRELTGGLPCNVMIACGRTVAQQLGAPWVVFAKLSKTSNLIWLLTAQLVRVGTGEIIIDDSIELKGDPGTMVPVGMRSVADRVARAVRQGGIVTNFPGADSTARP